MLTVLDRLGAYSNAFLADPADAAARFHAPDVVMQVPGDYPGAGRSVGREAVSASLAAVRTRTDGTLGPRALLGAWTTGESVLVRARFEATRDGRHQEWTRNIVYRFNGDLIAEIVVFDEDPDAVQALLGNDPLVP
jgi:ketosteroid isomerase-like protein